MVDKALQQRAGANTGTEPSTGWVVDKALQNKYVVKLGQEVTILQHSPDNNRLVVGKKKPGMYIYGICPTAGGESDFEAKWHNEFGETIDLLPFPNEVQDVMTLIGFSKFGSPISSGQGWMTMAPKEKITLKVVADGDGVFFVPTMDVKRKPKPSGGGGATDGNVVTVRGTITAQGLEVGPPPGKAWSGIGQGFGRLSTKIGHFGALTDNPVDVLEYLVDADGVPYFMEQLSTNGFNNAVAMPQDFTACGNMMFVESVGFLPLPTGRIQLLATFQEFDLPKDAQ
jgi:hypothetical protein